MKTPVVTILGHVDHGKTTLLDAIRGSNVASNEAGGITQKIGAFQISFKNHKITFIDTPGHEAFNKMRSRGANIADIAVLVVAANDGVQEQTKESIAHIKSAGIPFVVAITKIDMPNISLDKVKKQLSVAGVQVEGFGGDIVTIPISAKQKQGLDELLDMILLIWEMKSVEQKTEESKPDKKKISKSTKSMKSLPRASSQEMFQEGDQQDFQPKVDHHIINNPSDNLSNEYTQKIENKFIVIESYLDNKKGSIIHAIIKSGYFKIEDKIFVERAEGKIRALINDKGQKMEKVEEGDPVEILGFDKVVAVGSVGSTKKILSNTIQYYPIQTNTNKEGQDDGKKINDKESISGNPPEIRENPRAEEQEVERKKLNVILKTDNEGSLEAIRYSLPPEINLLLTGTGNVSESDILLAKTTKSFVVGFNVEIPHSASRLAELEGVSVKAYKIIYEMLEELKEVADSINEVTATEKIVGAAEILQDFLGTKNRIAGCKILEGKFHVGDKVRVERGEKIIGEAKISSIKMFKKDAEKVVSGQECGIVLNPEVDFRLNDIIISAKPIGKR